MGIKKWHITYLLINIAILQLQAQYYSADQNNSEQKNKAKSSAPAPKKSFWSNVYPGGNVGFGLSRNYVYVEVSPLIGYWFTDRITMGVTLSYIYLKYSSSYSQNNISWIFEYRSHIIGISPFARAFLLDWLFLHAEYGLYNGHAIKQNATGVYAEREFKGFPMLGGGILFRFARRSGLMLNVMYNFNYDSNFPIYGNPLIVRLGFMF